MNDEEFIWIGLFLIASSPLMLALVLLRFLSLARCRLVCHALSAALLLFLLAMYVLAARAKRLAGYDDGSSSMAAFLLVAAALVVIPENLLLYLPWRTKGDKKANQITRPGGSEKA